MLKSGFLTILQMIDEQMFLGHVVGQSCLNECQILSQVVKCINYFVIYGRQGTEQLGRFFSFFLLLFSVKVARGNPQVLLTSLGRKLYTF